MVSIDHQRTCCIDCCLQSLELFAGAFQLGNIFRLAGSLKCDCFEDPQSFLFVPDCGHNSGVEFHIVGKTVGSFCILVCIANHFIVVLLQIYGYVAGPLPLVIFIDLADGAVSLIQRKAHSCRTVGADFTIGHAFKNHHSVCIFTVGCYGSNRLLRLSGSNILQTDGHITHTIRLSVTVFVIRILTETAICIRYGIRSIVTSSLTTAGTGLLAIPAVDIPVLSTDSQDKFCAAITLCHHIITGIFSSIAVYNTAGNGQ